MDAISTLLDSYNVAVSKTDNLTFRDDAIFWHNCRIIISYNPTGTGTYTWNKLKARADSGKLSYVGYFSEKIETLTELPETLNVLRAICDRIFNECLKKKNDRLLNVIAVARQVFLGIQRMKVTYSDGPRDDAYWDLSRLADKSVSYLNQLPFSNISPLRLTDFMVTEELYYNNLDKLTRYNPDCVYDYSRHQIKVANGCLVYITSTYDPSKLLLTRLKETATVIKEIFDRAKSDYERYGDNSLAERIRKFALEGLIRMHKVYSHNYDQNSLYPGLTDLERIINNAEWMKSL